MESDRLTGSEGFACSHLVFDFIFFVRKDPPVYVPQHVKKKKIINLFPVYTNQLIFFKFLI